jgi:hypothetical protein
MRAARKHDLRGRRTPGGEPGSMPPVVTGRRRRACEGSFPNSVYPGSGGIAPDPRRRPIEKHGDATAAVPQPGGRPGRPRMREGLADHGPEFGGQGGSCGGVLAHRARAGGLPPEGFHVVAGGDAARPLHPARRTGGKFGNACPLALGAGISVVNGSLGRARDATHVVRRVRPTRPSK